jgi:thiol-disulfide isomerase/thioredoxin
MRLLKNITVNKILIAVSVLVIILLYLVTSFRNKPISNPENKEINYDFSIKDIEGNAVKFSEYKGKVVFLNLWATWCGPCRSEMPGIQNLYNKVNSEDIKFVMLSVEEESELNKVQTFVGRNKYTFPVFVSHEPLPRLFDVPSIPTTFIIDKNGKVAHYQQGSTQYDTEKYVDLLNSLSQK